jgi:hypothetical protein
VACAGRRGRPCRAAPSRRRPSASPPDAAAGRARCRGHCTPSSAGPPRARVRLGRLRVGCARRRNLGRGSTPARRSHRAGPWIHLAGRPFQPEYTRQYQSAAGPLAAVAGPPATRRWYRCEPQGQGRGATVAGGATCFALTDCPIAGEAPVGEASSAGCVGSPLVSRPASNRLVGTRRGAVETRHWNPRSTCESRH